MEGCYDSLGLNGHRDLPFYFEQNSLLYHDVSGRSIYCNPSWSLAIKCVEHLHACHSRSPLETRAVIVLPYWPKFKVLTKELKLIKRLPKGEKVFMRTSPTGNYVPSNLLPSIWPVNFWLINANTPVLSQLLTTNVNNLKPNIVKIEPELEAAIQTADEKLPTVAALVIMDPYEVEALMRFTPSVSYDGLSSKADHLIDTSASLNFVSKDFVVTNGFYKAFYSGG